MKLVGELKNNVEKAKTIEDAKKLIQDAGMELTDEEMNEVSGGETYPPIRPRSVTEIYGYVD